MDGKVAHDHRPSIVETESVDGFTLTEFGMENGPRFHVEVRDSRRVRIHRVRVEVDTRAQLAMAPPPPLGSALLRGMDADSQLRAKMGLPMFPFNTDGIDVGGQDIHVSDCFIRNYDDSVCIKATNGGEFLTNCTSRVLVENIDIEFGVGATVGSIAPEDDHNCISDITFRDVTFKDPFKAIYVKTNPADEGVSPTASIERVAYENIVVHNPSWFALYLGPQQMREPDGAGPGCLLWPLEKCPTEPRVTIKGERFKP